MTDLRTVRPEILLRPLGNVDPRTTIEPRDLVLAARNAYPVVAARPRRSSGDLGMAAGVGVALLLGGVTFWGMSGHRAAPAKLAAPVAAPVPTPLPPMAYTAPPPRAAMPPLPQAAPAPVLAAPPDGARSPVMVYDSSRPADAIAIPAEEGGQVATKAAAPATGGENEQFASRVGNERPDTAVAQAMADPATTVTQGTLIPAVLETAIDTDLPGYVRAVVSRDVLSFDGRHVLIPRSSRVIGQYKSGLAAGQTRAYVIWQRLIRPDGASVALGSPGVDFSGRTGLAGKVDGHFMKRFGSAALLSVIGGVSAIGNASVVLSGGQSAASVAASRDAGIPPTVRVAQGQPIRIFTARDLDFSTVPAAGG